MHRVLSLVIALWAWAAASGPAGAETLTVALEHADSPPYQFHQGGELTGLAPRVIEPVLAELGFETRFASMPWARLLHALEAGDVDGAAILFRTPEREAYAAFADEPLTVIAAHFMVSKTNGPVFDGTVAGLPPVRVGLVRGFFFGEAFEAATHFEKYPVSGDATLVRMVASGRVPVGVGVESVLRHQAHRLDLTDRVRFLEPALTADLGYVAFSRRAGRDELAADFSAALAAFKTTLAYRIILVDLGLMPTP